MRPDDLLKSVIRWTDITACLNFDNAMFCNKTLLESSVIHGWHMPIPQLLCESGACCGCGWSRRDYHIYMHMKYTTLGSVVCLINTIVDFGLALSQLVKMDIRRGMDWNPVHYGGSHEWYMDILWKTRQRGVSGMGHWRSWWVYIPPVWWIVDFYYTLSITLILQIMFMIRKRHDYVYGIWHHKVLRINSFEV